MILSLIGYRATGKTTVARLLAERLGVPWADSDCEIERQAGKTIAQIFADEGEAVFRDFEARVLWELCQSEDLVLATGGGAILRAETRQLLRQSGPVLWLTATPETILRRMQQDANNETTRPALTQLSQREEIRQVLDFRTPLYRETASLEITTEGFSPEEIVQQLLQAAQSVEPPETL